MKLLVSLAFCIAAANAQSIIESSSFGYDRRLSPNPDSIPGWRITGEGHTPQILSDRLILTPPYPGNTRGSVWAENAVSVPEWTAEFQFRASGPERGGGNLQLWYVKDGQASVGASSIYTVGRFDGFALTVDSHGGRGGTIRGFLNDGMTDYKSHANVDSLAFGHCEYPYRNLGRPSRILIKQTSSNFEVNVDGKTCFQTNKVVLPTGYTFGISAATPDTPDSFEIFRFALRSDRSLPAHQQQQQQQQQQQTNQQPINARSSDYGAAEDRPASYYTTSEQQFADLHNRLQLLNHATQNVYKDLAALARNSDSRHQELLQRTASTRDQLSAIDSRLQRIEQAIQALQRDVASKDYRNQFAQLHKAIETSHLSLTEGLQSSIFNMIHAASPRMGLFIFLIISFQLALAGLYVAYKRRRANMPKKFL
ncbi:hypothetical protein VTN96DRAFT_9016 [Rasamsonia emersonii]|uniref:Lectin family integral membrane protein n=1 Tax=Rasamsonia emersonii (strain ATCC 16479 / CBS 393.64 / IMI 116815) TaxID=1408163 RepID=A0A0F4YMB9_RASE3|nr:Lectin family integral membrane protein [Rasamsonia emersonii CBS 393.64]KKA19240.1 Lectin family integral membrane protein [Rasamsonia emersonii CBS 393.64]